ncbi:MAG TPA: bifunctional phosphopantothenoylcysteine decarboxylase/phosphopantothenate--cysteine ligase CoaBC [Patescibacteria group bacterium]|nr:bifunctional phosphopantothenoylcysteine decarboxylase/phosphopantothenate--cysteine ligase CoaBC [Patescibacteria group bacterium]
MRSRRRSRSNTGGLHDTNILLIVTGGIAAYKSAYLVRLLKRGGAAVRVVMTDAAAAFITPLTFEVLSENPVHRELFTPRSTPGVEHIDLARWADLIVVAPATADFLAKAAVGIAGDLAGTVLVAARCPVFFAPSMNEAMWLSPTVMRNRETLRRDGHRFIEPGAGELACGETGSGRMAEPGEIVAALEHASAPRALDGVRVLVTAGRTEEDIDPVRFISNRSSGRMGFALAARAAELGARVTIIHGPVDVPVPSADTVQRVKTAGEMKRTVMQFFPRCDILIMAAAVADYTPVRAAPGKVKRGDGTLSIELHPTVDILAAVSGKKRTDQIVVGFALETENAERNAREKAKRKGCDYLVLNRVGERTGFTAETNQVTLFRGSRKVLGTPLVSKAEAAAALLERIAADRRLRHG